VDIDPQVRPRLLSDKVIFILANKEKCTDSKQGQGYSSIIGELSASVPIGRSKNMQFGAETSEAILGGGAFHWKS
jgi:hypothetical protein